MTFLALKEYLEAKCKNITTTINEKDEELNYLDDCFSTNSLTHIKDFAYIGSHSLILPGVTIGEGAIVEVVAVANRCGVFLLLRRHGELHLREVGRQIVPGDVDVCIVVEIPVDARGQRRNV